VTRRDWLGPLAGPLSGWLAARRPPPALVGVAPPAPLFGRRRLDTEGDSAAARAVEAAHRLALEHAELDARERAARGATIVEGVRRAVRSAPTPGQPAELFRPALALAWGGRLFVGDEPRRWTEEAAARVATALERGVGSDGVVVGASVRAHVEALSDALECRGLLVPETDVDAHDDRLEQMLQAAADLRTPGRRSVDAPGAPQCLAAWRRLTGRRPQPRASFALESSGFYGVRAQRSLTLVDAGGDGRDTALALEWTVDGQRLLVAEGIDRAESNRAQRDALTLDGQARGRVERTRLEQLGHTVVVEALDRGFAGLRGKPVHSRRVTATVSGLSVEDYVAGGAGQEVCARLTLHPAVEVRRRRSSLVLVAGPVTALVETRHDVEVERAWWLGEDGEWRSTRSLVVRYAPAPCSGSFRIDRLCPTDARTGFLRRSALSLDRPLVAARASA
jgi:hypothetical protein